VAASKQFLTCHVLRFFFEDCRQRVVRACKKTQAVECFVLWRKRWRYRSCNLKGTVDACQRAERVRAETARRKFDHLPGTRTPATARCTRTSRRSRRPAAGSCNECMPGVRKDPVFIAVTPHKARTKKSRCQTRSEEQKARRSFVFSAAVLSVRVWLVSSVSRHVTTYPKTSPGSPPERAAAMCTVGTRTWSSRSPSPPSSSLSSLSSIFRQTPFVCNELFCTHDTP